MVVIEGPPWDACAFRELVQLIQRGVADDVCPKYVVRRPDGLVDEHCHQPIIPEPLVGRNSGISVVPWMNRPGSAGFA